jgi:predicted permease
MNPAEWIRRIQYLVNRRRLEEELEREMQSHRALLAESGATPARFGSPLRLREQSRDVWGWNWLDSASQDLRYAIRTLTPGYALTAGLILSLGIGLNLALFQMVNVLMLRTPPYKEPQTLARFYRMAKDSTSSSVPHRMAQFVRDNNRALSAVLTRRGGELAWGNDAADQVSVAFVSANWFAELGYGAARGRVFSEGTDERPDAAPVAVLGYRFWQTRMGGDAEIVGKTIRLNNRPVTVIGVAAANFPDVTVDSNVQAWLLARQTGHFLPGSDFEASWDSHTDLYGRFQPGMSAAAAKESLRATMAELARQQPDHVAADTWLEPYLAKDRFQNPSDRQEMWGMTLFAGGLTLLVLMVACGNLGNLVLSRATARVRELSVRVALGASRGRILRQLLMESLLLACLGSLGGLALGVSGAKLIATLTGLPPFLDFTPDARTLAAALAAGLVSAIAAGLAPAWRVSRHDLAAAMKDGGQQSSGSLERARLRKFLLATQVAGSCLLLAIAGLMARSVQRILTDDPGFDYEQVATLEPSLGIYGIKGEAARTWMMDVRRAVASHPESDSVAIVSMAPLGSSVNEGEFRDAPGLLISSFRVEPSFFALMKVPIVVGRNFEASDDPRTALIVSRRAAMEMYGTVNVVGRGFPKTSPERTIVGVTADARLVKIQANNVAEMYAPLDPKRFEDYLLIARARNDPARLLEPMRQAAKSADARVLAQARLMRDDLDRRLNPPRTAAALMAGTGFLALALACIGIYGVVSLGAASRTKEIGIRMALGAPRAGIVGLVMRQQAFPLVLGMLAGLAAAAAAGMLMRGDPFYVDPIDVPVQLAVIVAFGVTAGAATLGPALRVARRDPLGAIRHE